MASYGIALGLASWILRGATLGIAKITPNQVLVGIDLSGLLQQGDSLVVVAGSFKILRLLKRGIQRFYLFIPFWDASAFCAALPLPRQPAPQHPRP